MRKEEDGNNETEDTGIQTVSSSTTIDASSVENVSPAKKEGDMRKAESSRILLRL